MFRANRRTVCFIPGSYYTPAWFFYFIFICVISQRIHAEVQGTDCIFWTSKKKPSALRQENKGDIFHKYGVYFSQAYKCKLFSGNLSFGKSFLLAFSLFKWEERKGKSVELFLGAPDYTEHSLLTWTHFNSHNQWYHPTCDPHFLGEAGDCIQGPTEAELRF